MKGLLIDTEYCTGCFSCTVACKQENSYDADTWGIKVTEHIYTYPNGHVQVDYVPWPTNLCTLCEKRIHTGMDTRPACAKACQSAIIYYGEDADLIAMAKDL